MNLHRTFFVKKVLPILCLILAQGCLTGSRHYDFGETSSGVFSCIIKVPNYGDGVSVGADIVHHTEKYIPVKSLRVRITNEESHEIQIQGIHPFVLLKPGESHEFTVEAGPATKGVDGAYICGFGEAVRVKLDISGEHLDDTTIKITGDGAYGM